MKYIVVFITAKNRREAETIGRALVGEKLAASVNIFPGVRSRYWWKGKIETAREVFCMAKTRSTLFSALARRVKELHSYEVPEILALPISSGTADYLEWIGLSTGKAGGRK